MLRNNYPITRLVGASLIALSIFLFAFLYQDVMRQIEGDYFRMDDELLLFFGVIGTILIIGIGLLFRQKWARTLFVIFLIVFIAGLAWIIMPNLSRMDNFDMILMGGIVFTLTFAISLVSLLYNKKLNDEFDEKIVEELDETLDSQLFRESDSIS